MAWMWGLRERYKGLRNVLGSQKRLGTALEFVLSQNRNETSVNFRLFNCKFTNCVSELPAEPQILQLKEILSVDSSTVPVGDTQGHHKETGKKCLKSRGLREEDVQLTIHHDAVCRVSSSLPVLTPMARPVSLCLRHPEMSQIRREMHIVLDAI